MQCVKKTHKNLPGDCIVLDCTLKYIIQCFPLRYVLNGSSCCYIQMYKKVCISESFSDKIPILKCFVAIAFNLETNWNRMNDLLGYDDINLLHTNLNVLKRGT